MPEKRLFDQVRAAMLGDCVRLPRHRVRERLFAIEQQWKEPSDV
jgi:hypothetical protein